MSRALNDSDDIDSHETRIGTYPPQSAPTQAKHGEPDFIDGSGLIFSMYMEMATEEDKKMAENWTADADGILVFTGLFSSAVASMISISIQDIRPNPQDTSNFYLANIYYLQTVADTNRPNISSSLPSSPPPFSPPNYAVLVNALWFMSLVISISCALLATLLQQWARRYLRVTQPRYSLHKRAKIRTFFFDGVSAGHQALEIGALPTLLLHVSLFLFFAGLVVFLRNVHLTIFKLALSWVSMCMALYGLATFMPPIRHNTPFHTPFSPIAFPWVSLLVSYMQVPVSRMRASLRARFTLLPSIFSLRSFRKILPQGIRKTVEETALKLPVIDARALMWTFDSLDEDHELERFFSGFPGFRSSSVVDDPLPVLYSQKKERLSMGLIGLFDRTLSSDLLPEPVKNRRAIICAKALDPAQFPYAYWDILRRVMSEDQHRGLKTAEFVRVMRSWGGGRDRGTAVLGEAIFASLVARAQRHDDYWLISAPDKLGIPEADLRRCAADGNSLLLTSLIHMIRYQFSQLQKTSRPDYQLSEVLEAVSKFGVQDTSPDLQHEFCTLWNQVVLRAWRYYDKGLVTCILKPIRNVYITLHQGTNSSPTQFSASTRDDDPVLSYIYPYPVCKVADHIHDNFVSTTVSHDNGAPVPISLASPDNPSLSVSATPQAIESFMDMPLLDNFHTQASHQMTTESLSIPATSPDPATTDAFVTSGIIIPRPTSATSTSPPTAVTFPLQHNAGPLAPSDLPSHPSLASHPTFDNTLPTGLPLFSHSESPMARSDFAPSFPESRPSERVPTVPSASTGPASAPDLGVAAKDDDNPKPDPRKGKNTLDPPSGIHAIHTNAMVTLDPPPQSPSVTGMDTVTTSPSPREPNAERTGDHPPLPLHCPYHIV